MKKTFHTFEFSKIAASLGGAQRIEYGTRRARVTRADGTIVNMPLSKLPPRADWTAFNVADAADKAARKS